MGRPRLRTDLYRVMRVCERFPNWIPSPDAFYELPLDDQASLYGYELVREQEEAKQVL